MSDRLIIALDTADLPHALRLAELTRPHCGAFKVGSTLFNACAVHGVAPHLVRGGMLDLKFHDIPEQVFGAVSAVLPLAPRWLTVHASGGMLMVEAARRAAESAGEARPLILAVTLLTSLKPRDVRNFGFNESLAHHTLRLARLAMTAGADGVVCSVQHVARLRSELGSLILLTPGVRPTGTKTDDHEFTASPSEAVAAGADLVVVGRPITEAADPVRAAKSISKELRR